VHNPRWVLVARGAIFLGIVNLVRLIAEKLMVGSPSKDTYSIVLTADILLSGLLLLAGLGLLKGQVWAPPALLFSVGALFVTSLVLSVWMWPYFLRARGGGIRRSSDVLLGPRLLFYAFVVLASPYAAVILVRPGEARCPSRRRLIGWLAGGLIGSGMFVAILIARH
jgi:hypothetical protein